MSSPVQSFSPPISQDAISSSTQESVKSVSQTQVPIKSSVLAQIPSTAAPSYAERFKASLRNLKKISSPTYDADGTPVVQAPASVLLKTADQWKGHIIAQFHGLIPPPGKIYSDLNPAWGKHGNITIRTMSETSCLILIPCVSTRQWVLQIGYWQAGNCAFSVFPWSPEASLEMPELTSAPTWAILKNVPPQMYSLDGISVITSAIGEPLHTEKSRLDPFHFGDTKVKVEICLDSPPPSTIIVKDAQENTVRVNVTYPRLPPKCCNCDRFGHLLIRCPKPLLNINKADKVHSVFVPSGVAVAKTKISLAPDEVAMDPGALIEKEIQPQEKEVTTIPLMSRTIMESSQIMCPASKPARKVRTRSKSRTRGRSTPPVSIVARRKNEFEVDSQGPLQLNDLIRKRFADSSRRVKSESNSIVKPRSTDKTMTKDNSSGCLIKDSAIAAAGSPTVVRGLSKSAKKRAKKRLQNGFSPIAEHEGKSSGNCSDSSESNRARGMSSDMVSTL